VITPQVDQEPVAPQPTENVTPEPPTGDQTEGDTPEPQPNPYKEKFIASQRDASFLNERHKFSESRIEQLTEQVTPNDDAIRQLYPAWDQLEVQPGKSVASTLDGLAV
jgi:hypothetical protein